MRSKLAVTLALLGLACVGSALDVKSSSSNMKTLAQTRDFKKGAFGSIELTEFYEGDENEPAKVIKTVHLPKKSYIRDYERQTRALQQAQVQNKVNKERIADNKIYTCGNRGNVNPMGPDDAGVFIPVNVGQLNKANSQITYTAGTCYQNIKFSFS